MSLFIFIGRSGCGKGTQAKLLGDYLAAQEPSRQILHIETGELFRDFSSHPGYSNVLAKEVMEAGGRLPAFLSVWNWVRVMVEKFTGGEHIILDGSPRELIEAQMFESIRDFYPDLPVVVVYLNISRETAMSRLEKRGRADDQEKSDIENRLDWFDRDVMPAVDYFRSHPSYRLLDIDGEPNVETIHRDIVSKIN